MNVPARIALYALCAMSARVALAQAPATAPAPTPAPAAKDPHDVQPERPTVATHAGTVAPGWLEIEAGVEDDHFVSDAHSLITPTVFKFGVADNVQLDLFGQLSRPVHTAIGMGDAGVAVKWRLLDDAPILGDFALQPAVKFPTGSSADGRGTGTTDESMLAISSHDFGAVEMDLNVGYTHRSGNGTAAPTSATLWTASFGGSFTPALGWVAECYGYPATSGPAGQSSIVAILFGPTLLAKGWWAFDAGVIVPVTGPQPHAIYAGTVYNVGQLWGGKR